MERDTDAVFRELTDRLEEEFSRVANERTILEQRRQRRRRGTAIGALLAVGAMGVGLVNAPIGALLFLGSVTVLDRSWR